VALNISQVHTKENLLEELRRFDDGVPKRTKGRRSKHTEAWMICRLLSALANAGRLVYPLSVCHRSADNKSGGPDFVVHQKNGSIGVEATEVVPEGWAEYCALAEREFPDVILEPGLFRHDAPRRTKKELRKLLRQNKLSSRGWAGNEVEKEWALFFTESIEGKLTKLRGPHFERQDVNWLSMHDNAPQAAVDLQEAVGLLLPFLQNAWSNRLCFDAVFVEHDTTLVCITRDGAEFLCFER
jgi:hypothetical protein